MYIKIPTLTVCALLIQIFVPGSCWAQFHPDPDINEIFGWKLHFEQSAALLYDDIDQAEANIEHLKKMRTDLILKGQEITTEEKDLLEKVDHELVVQYEKLKIHTKRQEKLLEEANILRQKELRLLIDWEKDPWERNTHEIAYLEGELKLLDKKTEKLEKEIDDIQPLPGLELSESEEKKRASLKAELEKVEKEESTLKKSLEEKRAEKAKLKKDLKKADSDTVIPKPTQGMGWKLDLGVNGSSTDIVDQAARDSMMMSSLPLKSYEHDDTAYGLTVTGRYEFSTFSDRASDTDKEINTVTRQTAVHPYAELRFDYYDGPEAEEKFSGPDGGTASFRRTYLGYGIGLGGGFLIKPSVTSRWAIDLGAGISAMKSEIKLDARYDVNGHELDSFSDKSSHTYASPYGQLGFSYQMNSRLRLGAGVDVRRIEAKDSRLGKEYSDTPVGGFLKLSVGFD